MRFARISRISPLAEGEALQPAGSGSYPIPSEFLLANRRPHGARSGQRAAIRRRRISLREAPYVPQTEAVANRFAVAYCARSNPQEVSRSRNFSHAHEKPRRNAAAKKTIP